MRQISKKTLLLIVVGAIATLLVTLASILGGTLTGRLSSLPLWLIMVSIVVIGGLAAAFTLWYERLKSTPETLAVAREN